MLDKNGYFILRYLFFICLVAINCTEESSGLHQNDDSSSGPLFEHVSANHSGLSFQNHITPSPEMNWLTWDGIYFGGGVGVGDFNNDGLEDLYFTGNQADDALYLNNGDLRFTDISESSGIRSAPGWSSGVSILDINADGFLDIYICRTHWGRDDDNPTARKNKLFINQGNLTFTEESHQYGLDDIAYSTQATFLDYDKDGDLDLFLLNTPSNNISQKVAYEAQSSFPAFCADKFFINQNGRFEEAGKKVGVHAFSFGLGVIAADLDHDTWIDLYVANDYERPDYMYINQRDGTFKNKLDEKIKHTSFTSMGCDAADINNDGLVDLGVLDMQSSDHVRSKTNMPSMKVGQFWSYVAKGYNYQYMSNVLQLNHGAGYFSDIAQYAGTASTDWSWSLLFADFDNDGLKDQFVSNGINQDLRNNDFKTQLDDYNKEMQELDLFALSKSIPSNPLSNFIYKNIDGYQLKNMSDEWGLGEKSFSYGAAYSDLDNDGDLDLIINNNNSLASLYKNNTDGQKNNISITIEGRANNPWGIGTKIFVFHGDQIQYQELSPVRGYQSSSSYRIHFGLGIHEKIDSLVCIFPDGKSIRKYDLTTSKSLRFSHRNARAQPMNIYSFRPPLFSDHSKSSKLEFVHRENKYDDFQEETLLPHSQSTKGPYQAVGDVNADQLEDIFIGGASGQSGQLFLQSTDRTFQAVTGPWQSDAQFEDMGCVFIDYDGDDDLDLYVASGGNASSNPHDYHDRLYRNDRDQGFVLTTGVLPHLNANSSCVIKADYDGDGDDDLFIGGLVRYRQYPQPGESVLLRNDGGKFSSVAPSDLQQIGMVTSACWADINGDQRPDIILVGEWMKPTALVNTTDGFIQDDSWLSDRDILAGWYMHIQTSDLNRDGHPDFILGNFGTNNKFHPSIEKPLKIYSADFDDNNTNDIVLAKKYNGKYVPIRGRECSSEQMPFVAEKFETFSEFANASIETMLEEKIDLALALEVNEFRSGVLLSSPTGYSFSPFPAQAQFFPIMCSVVRDYNKDGLADILLAGNLFGAEVETTRHDAGNGLLLEASADGLYTARTILNSGFYAPFNTRSMSLVAGGDGIKDFIIVGANNNLTTVFLF